MSNKNTNGGSIWGQKMGLEFKRHVDHLFYMSGKPGLGSPAMFTAVDDEGNTNYTTGCQLYKSAGIEYKMATTNICSLIWELNASEDTSDVYSDDADWVDYKTFKGSQGTHDTKYDSFYEMKIPFSALGIDKNYIETNGIGAMLVATRGESGLDGIPFDDTMLDNATGDYTSDPSTSAEKDDVDVITSEFARIGKGGVTPTQPTTVRPTTQPTTAKPTQPTTQPVSDTLTVNASSNLNELKAVSKKYNADKNQVTVACKLQSSMDFVNCDLTLSYDSTKLQFNTANNLGSDGKLGIAPNLNTVVYNIKTPGKIKLVASSLDMYDFKTEKDLLKVTFDVIGKGTTDVELYVKDMAVGYIDSKTGYTISKSIVNSGVQVDVTGTAGFTGQKLSGSIVLGPEENILYGDINGDGKITVDDVTLLQLFVSGDKTIDSAAKIRADVNKDGVIDVLDCTDIQLYIAGDLSKLG